MPISERALDMVLPGLKGIMDIQDFERDILTSIKELKSDYSKVKNERIRSEIYKELFLYIQLFEDIQRYKETYGADE